MAERSQPIESTSESTSRPTVRDVQEQLTELQRLVEGHGETLASVADFTAKALHDIEALEKIFLQHTHTNHPVIADGLVALVVPATIEAALHAVILELQNNKRFREQVKLALGRVQQQYKKGPLTDLVAAVAGE